MLLFDCSYEQSIVSVYCVFVELWWDVMLKNMFHGENCVWNRCFIIRVFVNFIAPALIYDTVNLEQHVNNIFEYACQELV